MTARPVTISVQPASWRAMLMAIPRRNAAVTVEEQAHGGVNLHVPNRRLPWLKPPWRWLIRISPTKAVRLDRVGAVVWEMCDGAHTVEAIVEAFAARHAFTFHEARVAVTGYLRQLVQRGVLAMEVAALEGEGS